MPVSKQAVGRKVTAKVNHCLPGRILIYKSVSIPEPVLPKEPTPPTTIWGIPKYIMQVAKWSGQCAGYNKQVEIFNFVQEYEELRAHYAEAKYNRETIIPMKYRTGEPYPKTKGEAKSEIKILQRLIKEGQNGSGTSNTK